MWKTEWNSMQHQECCLGWKCNRKVSALFFESGSLDELLSASSTCSLIGYLSRLLSKMRWRAWQQRQLPEQICAGGLGTRPRIWWHCGAAVQHMGGHEEIKIQPDKQTSESEKRRRKREGSQGWTVAAVWLLWGVGTVDPGLFWVTNRVLRV